MALLGLDTAEKKTILFLYMGLGCAMRLCIYGSKKNEDAQDYNPNSVLAVVAISKLLFALAMYLMQDGDLALLVKQVKGSLQLMLRYSFPAFAYLVYDTLAFVNLANTDPVTYNILLQMRTPATGVVWQLFFNQFLTINQWTAIILLTLSCVLQNVGKIYESASAPSSSGAVNWSFVAVFLVCLQIAANVFSGVFNELLLKEKGAIGTNLQNMYMYFWTIVLNAVWLSICPPGLGKSSLTTALRPDNLAHLLNPWIIFSIICLTTIGLVTSLFLKRLDSVRKNIAATMEIFADVGLSRVVFGVAILPSTLVAVILAAAGILLYSTHQDVLGIRAWLKAMAPIVNHDVSTLARLELGLELAVTESPAQSPSPPTRQSQREKIVNV